MMMNYTGVYQVHSSCKSYKADATTTKMAFLIVTWLVHMKMTMM